MSDREQPPKPQAKQPAAEQPGARAKVAEKPKHAYHPAPWEVPDAEAIQALVEGKANSDQQRRALRWILEGACAYTDWAYRPGASSRDTDMCLGRQFVGHQILKLSRLNLSLFRKR